MGGYSGGCTRTGAPLAAWKRAIVTATSRLILPVVSGYHMRGKKGLTGGKRVEGKWRKKVAETDNSSFAHLIFFLLEIFSEGSSRSASSSSESASVFKMSSFRFRENIFRLEASVFGRFRETATASGSAVETFDSIVSGDDDAAGIVSVLISDSARPGIDLGPFLEWIFILFHRYSNFQPSQWSKVRISVSRLNPAPSVSTCNVPGWVEGFYPVPRKILWSSGWQQLMLAKYIMG